MEEVKDLTPQPKKVEKTKRPSLEYLRAKDKEPVKGIFRFYEVPGGKLKFPFKAYKQDPVERYELIDGMVYTLPLGVARHLNKNGWYPIHHYTVDEGGKPIPAIGQRVRRFGFQSLEFVDIDDITPVGAPESYTGSVGKVY